MALGSDVGCSVTNGLGGEESQSLAQVLKELRHTKEISLLLER